MLIYGDRMREVAPRDHVARIGRLLARAAAEPPGLARHASLVGALIMAGEFQQGLADAAFHASGCDETGPLGVGLCLMALAGAVRASWESGFRSAVPPAPDLPAALLAGPLPPAITVRQPEGYAFYALYPEAYLAAASALPRDRPIRVIGLRSIGTGLAALVAEAVGAPPPVTVRPFGHPFSRRIALGSDTERDLLTEPNAAFAVVDEGPGLSGSSFGAVADYLEDRGARAERIHFLPGHGGDLGPQASDRHRRRWSRAPRHVVGFDALVLDAPEPAHRLETWIADLVGPLLAPLEDVSGGAWRAHRLPDEASWPPALAHQERRKFLARTGDGSWLVKFAGLGEIGERKLSLARALAGAGFTPEVAGLRHGFLVERWMEAGSLDPTGDRAALVAHLGRYLGFRARLEVEAGASPDALLAMVRHNAAEVLGEDIASALDRLRDQLARLGPSLRPVAIDGRLHVHEWLRLPGGTLLKADAVDHHAAHDLVGAQDVAWDVAGAGAEFALEAEEQEQLRRAVEAEAGRPVDPDLVRLLTPCYLAFQLGSHAMAEAALAGWPEEAWRLNRAAASYATRLRNVLSSL